LYTNSFTCDFLSFFLYATAQVYNKKSFRFFLNLDVYMCAMCECVKRLLYMTFASNSLIFGIIAYAYSGQNQSAPDNTIIVYRSVFANSDPHSIYTRNFWHAGVICFIIADEECQNT